MSLFPGYDPISPEEKEQADRQIRQIQKEIHFDTRDFPVETIVSRFKNNKFLAPPYQREFIWNDEDQSAFVESVLMGLPIPVMFLAADDGGTFEIVDGLQRIQTLVDFVSDILRLCELKKLSTLNGFRFSSLPESQQERFTNSALRIVFLNEDVTEESRRDLFERINKYGRVLTASERRTGAISGPFIEFLERCAVDRIFKSTCPISKRMQMRKEPLELVTRFFAYSERYASFTHDVDNFLDDFVKDHKNQFEEARLSREFENTMRFVQKYFPYGFAKSSKATTTPRVRFEAIAVGTNLALRLQPDLVPSPVNAWVGTHEFKEETTTHGSNSATRLANRIEFVRDHLLAVR
jgi:Protein of unknown function DUF262